MFTLNIPHQGFAVSRSKVACAETVDALPEMTAPRFAIASNRTRSQPLCNPREIDILHEIHEADSGFRREPYSIQLGHKLVPELHDLRLLRKLSRAC